jgi:hypothetical protein
MLREVNYVSELVQGDIVLYMDEYFGFVEEIKIIESQHYDYEGNEWTEPELMVVIKWFDDHPVSVWTDTAVWNVTKVLR